jgi:hypothetical protein
MSDKVIHRHKLHVQYSASPKAKAAASTEVEVALSPPLLKQLTESSISVVKSPVQMNGVRAHDPSNRDPFISNHSGYGYKESSNYEHDNTGSIHNYSGVEDMVTEARIDNDGLTPGYDYD